VDRWLRTPLQSFFATAFLVVAAIYFARPVLAPVAVAGLLSVVLGGAVARVEHLGIGRFRLGRLASVLVVAIAISALFAAMVWIVVNEGSGLAEHLPEYQRTLHAKVRGPIDVFEGVLRQLPVGWGSAAGAPASSLGLVPQSSELVGFIGSWVGGVASLAATAGIVVVLLIFLLVERENLRDRVLRVAGRGDLRLTGSALHEASERVTRYLRALTLLNAGHGLAVGAGLALIGLPGALLFGLLAGVFRFVPYAGPLVSACAPLALSIAAFDGWTMFVVVGLYLGTLEIVSNNFFEPWMYGKSVGLSPFAVILSALFWAWIWGPIGLVLATPLTVCLVVMGRHVPGLESFSVLLSDAQGLEPSERIYERLLAHDLESATSLIAEQNGEQSAVATWDRILIPALRLLERDRLAGELAGEELVFVREAFEIWTAETTESSTGPGAASAPVLCIPSTAFADEIVAAVLAVLLEGKGLAGRATPRLATAALVEIVAADSEAIVCLSALDSRAAPVRHLVRRLRTGAPRRRLVVGFWGEDTARISELRASFASDVGVEIVASLEEAVHLLGGERPEEVNLPAAAAARDDHAPGTR
jgi:predicted PurR-regulated permease PerM